LRRAINDEGLIVIYVHDLDALMKKIYINTKSKIG
jgi:hypothetical protein